MTTAGANKGWLLSAAALVAAPALLAAGAGPARPVPVPWRARPLQGPVARGRAIATG